MLTSAGMLTTLVGTVFLTRVDPAVPAIVLGCALIGYLLLKLTRPDFRLTARTTSRLSPAVGLAGGLLQGTTGVSGPIVTSYLHSFGLHRPAFVLAITSVFQGMGLVQVGTFTALGRYDAATLLQVVAATIPIALMFPVGIWVGRRMDPKVFERAVLVVLFGMALKLLYDGFTGL